MESEVDLDTAPAMVISLADLQNQPEILQQLSDGHNVVYVQEDQQQMIQIGDQQYYQVVTTDDYGQVYAMQNEAEEVSVLDHQPQEIIQMAEPEVKEEYQVPPVQIAPKAVPPGSGKMVSILKPRVQMDLPPQPIVIEVDDELISGASEIHVENHPGPEQVHLEPDQVRLVSEERHAGPELVKMTSGQGQVGPQQVHEAPGQVKVGPEQAQVRPEQERVVPEHLEIRPAQVQVGPAQVQTGSGQEQIGPGQVQEGPGQVQIKPGQEQVEPGQVQIGPRQVQVEPEPVHIQSGQEHIGTDQVHVISSANAISTVHTTLSESIVLVSSAQQVAEPIRTEPTTAIVENPSAEIPTEKPSAENPTEERPNTESENPTVSAVHDDLSQSKTPKPTCTVVPMTTSQAMQASQAPVKSKRNKDPVSIDLTAESTESPPVEGQVEDPKEEKKIVIKVERSTDDLMIHLSKKRKLEEGEVLESDDDDICEDDVKEEEGQTVLEENDSDSDEEYTEASTVRYISSPRPTKKMVICCRCQQHFLPLKGLTNSDLPMCLRCDIPGRINRWKRTYKDDDEPVIKHEINTAEESSEISCLEEQLQPIIQAAPIIQPVASKQPVYQQTLKEQDVGQLPVIKGKRKVQLKVKAYHCTRCPKVFCMLDALKRHEINFGHKEPEGCHRCDQCYKTFTASRQLERHKRQTHFSDTPQEPLPCNICGKTFLLSNNLEDHLRTHSEERHFGCYVCPERFQTSRALAAHIRFHHTREEVDAATKVGKKAAEAVIITERPASESEEGDIKEEGKGHNSEIPDAGKVVEVITVTEEQQEEANKAKKVRWVPDNKKYRLKCKECSALFDKEEHLVRHRATHYTPAEMEKKAFTCDKCERPRVYLSQASLSRHLSEMHPGDSQIPCMFCGMKFSELFDLTMHLMKHRVTCKYCLEVFSHQTRLDSHKCAFKNVKLNLLGNKKEQIIRCVGAPFVGPADDHQDDSIADPIPALTIPVASSPADDQITVMTKSGEKVSVAKATCFICQECGKAFCSQQFLIKHMQKHST